MILEVVVEGVTHKIDVPGEMLTEGEDFFRQMDADMDKGYQMHREWVEKPGQEDRIRIVADRMLGAMESSKKTMAQLMAGYILTRMPGITGVDVDTGGEMQQTEIIMGGGHEFN